MADGEPEPEALVLGGEERVEDPRPRRRGDPAALVRHLGLDHVALPRAEIHLAEEGVEAHAGRERQAPAGRHRVEGVAQEVVEHLHAPVLVAEDRRQARAEAPHQPDLPLGARLLVERRDALAEVEEVVRCPAELDGAQGPPPALTAVHESLRLRAALSGRDRLAEAAHDRGVGGENLFEVAPLRAARRALGEHLGGGVPEDDPEARVDRDHRVGQAGEDRLVIHASSMSGRAFMLSGARSPARSRTVPAAVIIAALSVQSRGGGTWSVMPCKVASAASPALSGPFAATPPVRTTRLTPVRSAARTVLRTSILTTAAWKDAAMSATCPSPSGAWRFT